MLRYLTAGESHGRFLLGILEGMPSGLKVDKGTINLELKRRQSGFGRGARMAIEQDTVQVLSGLRKGATIGSPIALLIENKDTSIDAMPSITRPRPGHADLAGALKYNTSDIRDILERASARETAIRVAIGGVCRMFLDEFGVRIASHVIEIGGASRDKEMLKKVEECARTGDTLGGICEITAAGLPAGLGSHVSPDRRLDARIAGAMMSIQAIKGVEIGLGFAAARLPGSKVHDEITYDRKSGFSRGSNNAGGIEGGMTNGEPVVVKIAMKPIATLGKPLASVDIKTKKKVTAQVERHDVCAVYAASVVGEAVLAFELANAMSEKFGGDSMDEMKRNFDGYIKQVKSF
ncbi:MAG: chorismate synthase [Candidatus Omnitrophica bacterium]|nr:chorismate synthase [Candidatus Omnitrophota bacterium]MDD5736992.1 chorismate synthase [Candidatus Omnitrophota bacterium]